MYFSRILNTNYVIFQETMNEKNKFMNIKERTFLKAARRHFFIAAMLFCMSTANSDAQTIFSDNFNGAAYWTTINNSAGPDSANNASAAWMVQPDGYTNLYSFTFHSNDSTAFYLSDSPPYNPANTTDTYLQSPAFSTLGYADSAIISFYDLFFISTTTKTYSVDASVNGSSWTTLASWNDTVGHGNGQGGFVTTPTTVTLPDAFMGQAIVYIRFHYYAPGPSPNNPSNFDFWAIDNVSITGTPVATVIGEVQHAQPLFIYPNPSHGFICLPHGVKEAAVMKLKVMNALGETVETIDHPAIQNDNEPIDLSALASGLYFLELSDDGNKIFEGTILIAH